MESKVALNQRVKQVVDIKFKNLKYAVNVPKEKKKKKYVLKGLNGTFKSGELTAIMGPSGAGKSSLMNILTGFVKNGVDGTINFGNKVQHARKSCAYIMQDDFFYTWFTVEETMMLAATLKISNKSMNLKEKKLLIEQLLETLKLSETKETRCGRLSGGQRKRLSIALELIDNPAVLFLDEPTTGLDSSSSFDTICLLELLAAEGRTIVCTIHQPSSNIYYLFNQIYVMSNGYCTYQGTPRNTVQFLQSVGLECPAYHNPADFIIECVSGDFGDYTKVLAEQAKDKRWRYDLPEDLENMNEFQLAKYNEMKRPSTFSSHRPSLISSLGCDGNKHVYPPPEWMRLWLIIGRCHMQFFRDWTVTYLKLFVHIVTAILLGFLFGDSGQNASKQVSNIGSFLVHLIYLWYTTMMPAILRFPDEIFIIKKETFNNWYKLRTYYMAALITSTPVHIIFSSVYVSILYVMTEQPIEIERYVKFLLAVVFVTICADGMGVFLGTVLNPVNGTFIGAITTCFLMMYSGYLIFLSHMSKIMYYVAYLSPIRYGFESMLLSVYSSHRESLECPETERFCYMKNPVTVLRIFGLEQGSYNFNIAMIFLQIVLFKVLAYFTLKQKLKSSI